MKDIPRRRILLIESISFSYSKRFLHQIKNNNNDTKFIGRKNIQTFKTNEKRVYVQCTFKIGKMHVITYTQKKSTEIEFSKFSVCSINDAVLSVSGKIYPMISIELGT